MGIQTVLGLFENVEQAERAVQALNRLGLGREQISIVTSEKNVQEHLGGDAKRSVLESAGVGAATGGAVGGLIGLLAGASLLLFPGVGPVVASGGLALALGATAAGVGAGAFHGAFAGTLIALGLSEENAHNYVESVRRGQVLIAVETGQETVSAVVDGLHQAGAHEVDAREGSWKTQESPAGPGREERAGDSGLAARLADLAGQCSDAEEGFRMAVGNVRDDLLVKLLDGYARQYQAFGRTLGEEAQHQGGPEKQGAGQVGQALKQGLVNITAAMTIEEPKSAHAVVVAVQAVVEKLERSYRQALAEPLSDDVRSMLEHQYAETQETRKKLSQAEASLAG